MIISAIMMMVHFIAAMLLAFVLLKLSIRWWKWILAAIGVSIVIHIIVIIVVMFRLGS